MEIKEFEIPVHWGHVAVKAWGNEKDTPVLAVHGVSDNAGTFDRLIPHLPTAFYYICVDLPSHGKSSPFPPAVAIKVLDYVVTIKLIIDYLKKKEIIYMGHSWGGQIGFLFTQLYPEYVTKLIILDSMYLLPVEVDTFRDNVTGRIDKLIKINDNLAKESLPTYTYDEAITKLIRNRLYGELYRESAESLARRCLVPVEDGKFRFTTDPRLRVFINFLYDLKFTTALVKKYSLKCPTLFIITTETNPLLDYFDAIVRELKGQRNVTFKNVTGSHDVHSNSPERVAPIINKFLLSVKSKI